jgi:hypothetical protein
MTKQEFCVVYRFLRIRKKWSYEKLFFSPQIHSLQYNFINAALQGFILMPKGMKKPSEGDYVLLHNYLIGYLQGNNVIESNIPF